MSVHSLNDWRIDYGPWITIELTRIASLAIRDRDILIMESLVKKKQKDAVLELKQRHLKNTIFCTYTSYPAMKIRRISASSAQETRNDQFPIRRIHYNQYAVCTAVHQHRLRVRDGSPFCHDCSCLGLRMKYRLSLKNDMPLRDKIIIALINKPAFYRIIHG
ncbi:hypothetical protein Tco_0536711 [Tanacetum coccineum]